MKKKIIGIFVCMLMIATTFPVFSMEINKEFVNNNIEDSSKEISSKLDPPQSLPIWWLGVDQKHTKNCGSGEWIQPPIWIAQEFKPSRDKLIGVELWMFRYGKPPAGLNITVSIRDSLNGSDLTVTTVNADPVKHGPFGTWVLFDFDDITVTPEKTYYIVCRGGGGDHNNTFCWFFNVNNSYTRGIAWLSDDNGGTWFDLEDWDPNFPKIDFCFKTYNSKPRIKPFIFNINLISCLFERLSNVFPILRHLMKL